MHKLLVTSLLVFAAVFTVPAQQTESRTIPANLLSFRNVAIGTDRSQLISILGKAQKSKRGTDREMGLGKWEKLFYPGLEVEVTMPERGYLKKQPREPYVWRYVITSSDWVLKCGLHVGDSREKVVSCLGAPGSETRSGKMVTLHYNPSKFNGLIWFGFSGNVLTNIGICEDWT